MPNILPANVSVVNTALQNAILSNCCRPHLFHVSHDKRYRDFLAEFDFLFMVEKYQRNVRKTRWPRRKCLCRFMVVSFHCSRYFHFNYFSASVVFDVDHILSMSYPVVISDAFLRGTGFLHSLQHFVSAAFSDDLHDVMLAAVIMN